MTSPELSAWPATDRRYRRSEDTAFLGRGAAVWERTTAQVLRWRVKTASGFTVDSTEPVSVGERLDIRVHLLGRVIIEPVEVTSVVAEADRVGFAYTTRPGHPVEGEEAFIVHRQDDTVHLTVRSLTRAAAEQPWRALFPFLLVAQRVVRRRYLRALR
ncbi:DUF1990 family protein [Arthrobacter sp.]|uniref:DUF1990 family protein n=1 Tax=Arthrobacter sp. TaxID=1667 RepID=UPI003A914175